MTTEKEFWASAGRYFRTLTSIQTVIDELQEDSALSKDMRAIKSMKKIENIMKASGKPEDTSINISRIIEGQKEPIIDEGCVGCCKVVDIAARLQNELDEYKKINDDQSRTIHYLKQEIVGRKDQLMEQREATESKEREVLRLKDKHADTIEELKDQNIDDLKELYDFHEGELEWFKDELSAYKQDSEVLKKVVEVINDWRSPKYDHHTPYDRMKLYSVYQLVREYLDAPEVPPKTPIDDLYRTSVSIFLEMP